MADLVIDLDYDITKAEAKQRKLNRELELSQKQADAIKKNIESLNSALDDEAKKQKAIRDEISQQSQEAGKLALQIERIEGGYATLDERMSFGSLDAAKKRLSEMEGSIKKLENEYDKSATNSKKLTKEISKQELKLDKQNAKTKEIGDNIASSADKREGFNKAVNRSDTPLAKFGKRIKELVKSALIFSVITKALNGMKEALGSYLKQDSKLSASVAKLKGNLATIGSTIMSSLAPYIQWVVDKLVSLTSLIGTGLAKLLGKDIKQMAKLAKTTEEVEEAAKGSLASFDQVNTLSENKNSKGNSAGLDTSAVTSVDDGELDSFITKLETALPYVTAIGFGLVAWNIINFLKQFEKINNFLTGGKIAGIIMVVAGLVLLIWNYCDAWINGLDWSNFTGILIGVAIIVGGLALAFGSIAAGIGAIVGGIAMVVIGIKDWIENGKSLQSVLMVAVGIIAIGLGLMMLGLGWPALLVAAIVAAIVVIAAYWEEIKSAVSNFITWFSENVLDKLFGKGFGDALQGMWDSFTQVFEDIISFFKHVFKGEWKEAGKAIVNVLIDFVNYFINKINAALQLFLGGGAKLINGIGKLFGAEWNLNASNIKIPTIPRLATGAVIPGGSPFLAVLGDQRKGQTNIEAPLDTIKQGLAEVLAQMGGFNSQNNQPIIIQVDGREIARATRSGNDKLGTQTVFGGFANVY